MKIVVLALSLVLLCSGCAMLSKAVNTIAPSQVDDQGNPIPGTHTATELTNLVANAVPYGSVALSVILLIANGLEIAKRKKTETGLWATIKAIEEASKDPAMQDMIAQLKKQLAEEHKAFDVQPLINALLAKLKFKV